MIVRDALASLSGLAVGILSGVMGVGGGIFLVPIMVIGFALPQQVAQGTSLVAIIPTSLVGAITHARQGNVDLSAAVTMGAAGSLGAVIGALAALHLPREILGRIFGLLLLYAAYRLWPRRLGDGGRVPF